MSRWDNDNAMEKYTYPIEQSREKLHLEIGSVSKPQLMNCVTNLNMHKKGRAISDPALKISGLGGTERG